MYGERVCMKGRCVCVRIKIQNNDGACLLAISSCMCMCMWADDVCMRVQRGGVLVPTR
jgi:hypothetical protein